MAVTKEIGYFNAFVLKAANASKTWHIEETRIKGGFNNTALELGVRAFLVDENYAVERRKNAIIYSGIYNSKTGVNNLNQFSIGDNITKAVDIADGSIQKLYAEDTNLLILQEDKVSRALIDKDAIFTAEGSPIKSTSNIVIGQIVPFLGKYGISNDPESFAIKGGMKYFTDKKRGVVIRLSRDGHTEISYYGMRSWFKNNLKTADKIVGMYDNVKDQYVVSLQNNSNYYTLGYDESSKGWVSFYSYKPSSGFTLNNVFYSFRDADLYTHYTSNNYNKFYEGNLNPYEESKVTLVINNTPSAVKVFKTLAYEGTNGWQAKNIITNDSGDKAFDVSQYSTSLDYDTPGLSSFNKKENKYSSYLKNNSDFGNNDILFAQEISGIKGMYVSIDLETYVESGIQTSAKELFAVSSETVLSSN